MNASLQIRTITIAICCTMLTGCLEIKTTTTIHPGGGITRTIGTSGDSSEVRRDLGIFVVDSSWSVSMQKADTTWESTATRYFPDVQAFQKALDKGGDRALRVRAFLAEYFAWFTTRYEYRETIVCYNQIHAVPLSAYVPEGDQEQLIRHEIEKVPYASVADSVRLQALSGRTEEWDRRNKFEAFHARFVQGVENAHDTRLAALLTPAMKETLFVHSSSSINAGTLEQLPLTYAKVLKSAGVAKVFEREQARFNEYAEAMKTQEEILMSGYKKAAIVMPGVLTGTNGRSIEGNRVVWEDFLGGAYVADYTMWATSRVINWWAVILTGAVVLFLASLPLVAMIRKSRRSLPAL
jgi:hypothetical protein